ncbi:putative polyketide synthase [Mycena pura]|uniref:Polyketide synthase n=1 Tax=Mycena pura TaxID=153505 RepID=A0AAD6V9K1_9AGAR|nr:putative polyketide synthase [Mycena pura]
MIPPATVDIPIFAGQGTSGTSAARTQALQDARTSSGATLLSACHEVFHIELLSLPPDCLSSAGVELEDFKRRESLLDAPTAKYQHNPIISGTTLFLFHSLRYLSFVESYGLATGSLTPFRDVLKRSDCILGFSSGILPACVVASSADLVDYITHAVQAYRLAIWVGVRTQIYRAKTLADAHVTDADSDLPWSLVILGASKLEVEDLPSAPSTSLYITAVMDGSSVSISGRPDMLAQFSKTLGSRYAVHKTTLDTLYHSPVHAAAHGARLEVMADIARRDIRFPHFRDLKVPIHSTFTGADVTRRTQIGSLVELVVDMILTQPVYWNLVTGNIFEALPDTVSIRLLNFGPGTGLLKTTERAFPRARVSSVDVTRDAQPDSHHVGAKQEPIAIVGMGINMPSAPNKDKLWAILENGINTISEIPGHRFKVEDYDGKKYPGRQMKARTGNFLDDVDAFDNKFFKISPREAKSMDPQQRILLHTAYEALEDSGYVPNATPSFRPETFGCYIGVATGDYVQNLRDEVDVYYSTGTLRAFLSGRISFAMKLSGPSITVDTACSSSNVAMYQGVRALMNRDCDAALVGGVNVVSSPDMFLGLDRGHFLSPTGQCKAFDASADGYSRAEGCGIFILKRLRDAEAENDNILGIVRGIEVNQSGLAHSITYPHAATQAALFRKVLQNSGIDPTRVNVVEAHGTGTQAGDPNEMESLRSVLAPNRAPNNPLHITSVKANIGHLEAASGAAGLAKLLLMLQHRLIPRQISFQTLNPLMTPLEDDNTIIDQTQTPWLPSHAGMTRVALLNNFGAAGSNTALVLEEHVKPVSAPPLHTMSFVFGMSAKTVPALEELRAKYIDWLRSPASADVALSDIAYTATARRQLYGCRIAVSASTLAELAEKLVGAEIAQTPNELAKAVFVFSGQGSQYIGMGRQLYEECALFREFIDECHNVLATAGFPGVHAIILGTEASGLGALEEVEAYQASIFSLECGLAKLWMSWGLVPSAVVGHSLGEYAALVTAGVLGLKDALLIVAHRVRLMVQKCNIDSTTMIAVNLDPQAVEEILCQCTGVPDLTIACYNSPVDCVLSGPLVQLIIFKAHLDSEVRCKNVFLSVPFGYHSTAMAPLLDDLTDIAKGFTLRPPMIPIVSNVLGDVVLPGDASIFTAAYFSHHCTEPVQFDRGVRALLSRPEFRKVDAWLELGPHNACLGMLKAIPAVPKDGLFLASLRKSQPSSATLTASLAQLFTSNFTLNWRATFAHLPRVTCISMPSYPLAKTKFWLAFQETRPAPVVDAPADSQAHDLVTAYSLLRRWAQYPSADNDFVAIFETPICDLAASIVGHCVGGVPLCPASVYIELVLAGVDLSGRHLQESHHDSHAVLRRTEFENPLVYNDMVASTVLTTIARPKGQGTFSVKSRVNATGEESVHVRGEFKYQPTLRTTAKFVQMLPFISRHIAAVQSQGGNPPERFSTRTAYEVIFPRVVDYAKQYHTIQSLTVDASGMEGCATIQLPADYDRGKFVVHPVWMDTLLHVAGFVANLQGGIGDAFICSQVGAVKVFPALVNNDKPYLVYCSNAWLPEKGTMIAEAYAVQIAEPRRIVAHMKAMHFRRVRLSSLKKSLAHAAGEPPSVKIAESTQENHGSPLPPSIEDVTATVLKLISDACDVPATSVDLSTDLASLGIDSMMSIEIFAGLRDAFSSAELDAHVLLFCTTIADICGEIVSSVKTAPSTETLVEDTSSQLTLLDEKQLELDIANPDRALDVMPILSSVLEVSIDSLEADIDLGSLGLDSLTSIEARRALKTQFGADLPSDFFTIYSTASAVQAYFSGPKRAEVVQPSPAAVLSSTKQKSMQPSGSLRLAHSLLDASFTRIGRALQLDAIPVPIQQPETSGRLPLFVIHDGSGLVNYYDRVSFLDRAIWGIHNPRFASGRPWDGLVDMAAAYVDYILSTTAGPLLLGGWSFGGVVAYEIALQLTARGIQVKGILLIDSPSPINHTPLSDALIDTVINLDARAACSELRALVKKQFSMNARMLEKYVPHATASVCPPLVLLRSSDGFRLKGVDIPAWLADRSDPQTSVVGWQSLAHCSVKVLDIPGHHFEPFRSSNVSELSLRIADACEYFECL